MKNTSHTISDVIVMTKRSLIHYRRLPQLIVFSFVQPMMLLQMNFLKLSSHLPSYCTMLCSENLLRLVLLTQTILHRLFSEE
jgi:hypothetical protein